VCGFNITLTLIMTSESDVITHNRIVVDMLYHDFNMNKSSSFFNLFLVAV